MAIVTTVALSILGVILAISINLPLAFLLGPLIVLTLSSVIKARVTSIPLLDRPVFFVLGVYLGSTLFTSVQSIDLSFLGGSLLYMIAVNIIAIFIGSWFFIKFANYSKVEAVLAALPGLLAYIVTYCVSYKISFEKVVVPHTIRVIMVVMLMPFIYGSIYGVESTQNLDISYINWNILTVDTSYVLDVFWAIVIISICAIPLLIIFQKLRVANFYFLAGMLAAIVVYYTTLVDVVLPHSGLQIILMLIGIIIGTRLAKIKHKSLVSYSIIGIISTLLLLVIIVVFSYLASLLFAQEFSSIFLAYAPGGVHEMVLIAIIYSVEPLFVTVHHLVRIIIISIALPFIKIIAK